MNDVIYADVMEFRVGRDALSSGATHATMFDNLRAVCELLGLELLDYDSAIRIPVGSDMTFRVMGRLWRQNR